MAAAIPEVAAAAGGETAAAGTVEGGALRTPRGGGGAMALDGANRPPKAPAKRAPVKRAAPAAPAPQEPAPEEPAEEPQEQRQRRALPNPGGAVREGSWVVLGFLGWVWVALPFIKRGPSGVGQVLAAKFANRTPDNGK